MYQIVPPHADVFFISQFHSLYEVTMAFCFLPKVPAKIYSLGFYFLISLINFK